MVLTIFLLLFLFLVPKEFKKLGIKNIIESKKKLGVFLFITSKLIWWFIFLQLTTIWFHEYLTYVLVFVVAAFLYRIYEDRKYLFLNFKRKKPSY